MKKGFVISDLHLLAQRSAAEDYIPALHDQLGQTDTLVLNGDIFDFKWSTLADFESSLDWAANWVTTLIETFDHCDIHYVLGNHDGLREFVERLEKIEQLHAGFDWQESHLRLGHAFFLHGDLPLHQKPVRTYPDYQPKLRKPHAHHLYDRALDARVPHAISRAWSRRVCAKRVLNMMARLPADHVEGVTDIYFGHTHRSFSDFSYRDYTFHNTGSTIRGMKCNMLPFEWEAHETV